MQNIFDESSLGLWNNKVEFLFEGEFKRQEGETYLDQHHFIRYVASDGCAENFCWKHYKDK